MIEAFPWETAPKYQLRDRDGIYGAQFVPRVKGMGIDEVPIWPDRLGRIRMWSG